MFQNTIRHLGRRQIIATPPSLFNPTTTIQSQPFPMLFPTTSSAPITPLSTTLVRLKSRQTTLITPTRRSITSNFHSNNPSSSTSKLSLPRVKTLIPIRTLHSSIPTLISTPFKQQSLITARTLLPSLISPLITTSLSYFSSSSQSPPESSSSSSSQSESLMPSIPCSAPSPLKASETVPKSPEQQQLEEDIKEIIETKIAEGIRLDGGDIHFIQYLPDQKIVEVALSGACESCDRSAITLQILVSNALKHYFPGIIEKVRRVYLPGQEPH